MPCSRLDPIRFCPSSHKSLNPNSFESVDRVLSTGNQESVRLQQLRLEGIVMDIPAPCRTLYIRNLPEKLNKQRLRRLLHAAFSPHGRIVWIVAEHILKLRGQAFITFETQASATTAMRAMHATEFMGKQIVVTYSKNVSDRGGSKKLGGDSDLSRTERAKKRRDEKARKVEEENKKLNMQVEDVNVPVINPPEPGLVPNPTLVPPAPIMIPNRILFIENLPEKIGTDNQQSMGDVLTNLFARFSGFVEVRTVPGKASLAFVEFGTETESAVALGGLQDHEIGDPPQQMRVSFAKK